MIFRIDVCARKEASSVELASQIKDLGIGKARTIKVYCRKVYFIEGDLAPDQLHTIATRLLIDPVIESYILHKGIFDARPKPLEIIITYNPGVCDPVALSLERAIGDLSLAVKNTRTGRLYIFEGLKEKDIQYLAPKLLYNPLIEHILDYEKNRNRSTLDEFAGRDYAFTLVTVDMLNANDEELLEISRQRCLSLSLQEMHIIKDYFRGLKRNPTDCELETIAVLWSEHCGHKTFRGIIDYKEQDENAQTVKRITIDNLLSSTIMKATTEINSPGCVSVFHDNSGVVRFDETYNICFKVETHNHPSSLEPYGGASTGIGGVIRDILGTGCAAKPFASIDVFCFSPWHIAYEDLPKGLLHPKRIIKGVVRGVRDYGNRMGIPTVAGAVLFAERFLGNPLVYCGTLGLIPKEKSFKKVERGDLIILCGARTGRDGIHGATFSSQELDEETISLTSAVQIGNAIEEKKLTEAILRARDKNLFNAITDCGAGGLSSAVSELAYGQGAEVHLERVPLKYRGLSYTDIWISESQERMVLFAKEENLKELEDIFKEEEVELTTIGKVTDDKKLKLFHQGNKVCELDLDFIFNLPKLKKKAVWTKKKEKDVTLNSKKSYSQDLKSLLSAPNVASKDWILREYDHEVQSGSVLKSISGIERLSVSDAAVLRPELKSKRCIAVGLGINPFYSDIDPYWMAALSIEEALRNLVCVGAKLERSFILDNFSWGSALDENTLGGLVRAALGCYDLAKYFAVPFISGKDSLYNEYVIGNKRISIPGTLLISGVAVLNDWSKCITANLKRDGNLIYIIGPTQKELGCSEYFRFLKIRGGYVPRVDMQIAKKTLGAVSGAIEKSLIVSCHDLSEGGLAVAIAEMCIGSSLGANLFLQEVPHYQDLLDYELLFSESASRFLVEVSKNRKLKFEKEIKGIPRGLIGCVSKDKRLVIYNQKGKEIVNCKVEDLRRAWLSTFEEFR